MNEHKHTCQDCGGVGGYTDVILDDGTGPWEPCGFCNGTGRMTSRMRGIWLTLKRYEKRGRRYGI